MLQGNLKKFQQEFYLHPELIQLNNAGLQPISKSAYEKINYWSQRFWQEGYNTDADYARDVQHSKDTLAQLLGCQSTEVAFFTSTSGAVSQLAFAMDLKSEDEVLMWDQEFASHMYPWRSACEQKNAKLVLVESEKNFSTPTEKMIQAITNKTKVIAFSWVQFISGAQMEDVESLIKYAKERDIYVFVDVIQGLGLYECNLWKLGVDALVGGSHKWLFSPVGVGYLALRQKHISKFKPHVIGVSTYGTCDDPTSLVCEPKTNALKFEPGSKQVLEITALGASIDVIHKVGVKTIEDEALRLGKILRLELIEKGHDVISPYEGEKMHSTPFINFKPRHQKSIKEVSQVLNQNKVFHALRGPGIRFTTQAFNREDDIIKAIQVLETV